MWCSVRRSGRSRGARSRSTDGATGRSCPSASTAAWRSLWTFDDLFVAFVVVRLARGDVVDIRQIFAHVVHVVERERTAGDLHRDRSARTLGFLLLRDRVLAALRLGVGPEVAVARRRRRVGIEARTASVSTAAGARAAKAAAGARPRPAESRAARARSAEPAAGARSAGPAILTSARVAYRQRTAVEHLSVEFLNRLFGVRAVLELDEREPARAPGLAIDGQNDLGRGGHCAEVRTKVGFSRGVREITNEQTDGQSTLS